MDDIKTKPSEAVPPPAAGYAPPEAACDSETVICEALVREIGIAQRWQGMVEAWQALLRVRQMARSLKMERDQRENPPGGGKAHIAKLCDPAPEDVQT